MPVQRPLYVYYQEPIHENWVTVGAYKHDADSKSGSFTYLEDFTESGAAVSIDPFNLPIRPGKPTQFLAKRYGGLHDVLRDSGPDGWGCYLLAKFGGLSHNSTSLDFLKKSGNDDRWGALAIGNSAKAPSTMLEVPSLPSFDLLVEELAAMEEGKPAVDPKLRKRLQEYSGGGARPKATVKDKEGVLWIAKPRSRYDHLETPVDFVVQKARECFSEPASVLTTNVRDSVQKHFDKTSQLLDGSR